MSDRASRSPQGRPPVGNILSPRPDPEHWPSAQTGPPTATGAVAGWQRATPWPRSRCAAAARPVLALHPTRPDRARHRPNRGWRRAGAARRHGADRPGGWPSRHPSRRAGPPSPEGRPPPRGEAVEGGALVRREGGRRRLAGLEERQHRLEEGEAPGRRTLRLAAAVVLVAAALDHVAPSQIPHGAADGVLGQPRHPGHLPHRPARALAQAEQDHEACAANAMAGPRHAVERAGEEIGHGSELPVERQVAARGEPCGAARGRGDRPSRRALCGDASEAHRGPPTGSEGFRDYLREPIEGGPGLDGLEIRGTVSHHPMIEALGGPGVVMADHGARGPKARARGAADRPGRAPGTNRAAPLHRPKRRAASLAHRSGGGPRHAVRRRTRRRPRRGLLAPTARAAARVGRSSWGSWWL